MNCNICKTDEATIHIQEVANNNIKSLHICEKCAKNYGFNNELIDIGFHLMDFLHNFKSDEKEIESQQEQAEKNQKAYLEDESIIKCFQCNTTYNEFLETGKFGCSFCYIAFKEQVKPIIRRLQGKAVHKGSVPDKYKKKLKSIRTIISLNHRLRYAVKKEDFKAAASLRDKIQQTKNRLEKSND